MRARRFVGRLERGSEDVGIDSGIGSDILKGVLEGWNEDGEMRLCAARNEL